MNSAGEVSNPFVPSPFRWIRGLRRVLSTPVAQLYLRQDYPKRLPDFRIIIPAGFLNSAIIAVSLWASYGRSLDHLMYFYSVFLPFVTALIIGIVGTAVLTIKDVNYKYRGDIISGKLDILLSTPLKSRDILRNFAIALIAICCYPLLEVILFLTGLIAGCIISGVLIGFSSFPDRIGDMGITLVVLVGIMIQTVGVVLGMGSTVPYSNSPVANFLHLSFAVPLVLLSLIFVWFINPAGSLWVFTAMAWVMFLTFTIQLGMTGIGLILTPTLDCEQVRRPGVFEPESSTSIMLVKQSEFAKEMEAAPGK